jgi:hypothetical protein
MRTCNKEKPFKIQGKCVEKCNPGMVLDEYNRCVYSCPQDKTLNEKDGRCTKCVEGLYGYKDECVSKCPEDAKVVDITKDGMVCVKECPPFKRTVLDSVDGISYCIPNCESDKLYDPVTLRCVEGCNVYAPFESMKDGVRICDNVCPSYYTQENKCVDLCAPELVKYYKGRRYCGNCPAGTSISALDIQQCIDNV